jgi:hypothetical protein
MQITPANAAMVKSIIDLLDLPDKDKLKDSIDQAASMMGAQAGIPGVPGMPMGNVPNMPPQVQQLEQVMAQAGLSEPEQATLMQLLQSMPDDQAAEFLNATPQEQIATIQQLMSDK